MRTYLPLTVIATLLLIACKKESVPPPAPQLVAKNITFHVFAAKDYSGPVYANVKADVVLQVNSVSNATGVTTVLWDTTYTARDLAQYPQQSQMHVVTKKFNVDDKKEMLYSGYSIRYNDNGMQNFESYSESLGPQQKSLLLEASL